jgi:uncharacterized protein YuzB (UPF0349 family)
MNIKMCVSNLDLFAGESAKKAAEGLLGYCYWCPQRLMALVDGILVTDLQ